MGAQVWASGRETRCDRWSRSLVAESRVNLAMTHRTAKVPTPESGMRETCSNPNPLPLTDATVIPMEKDQ